MFENHYWFLIVYFIGIIAYIILIALMEIRISRGYLTRKLALKTIGFVFIVLAIMILLIYLEG
ncbi:hypothetical protein [Geomicrobium sp. JCM 19055]|uniref:hypothetical protein n=1 Tax=Geomicrobium sp. JCM 19055 TaxID=1460649 RepID=UPI0005AA76AE|nr:hypothetical protein [Geomicrobium sp. JCM 19055]